MLRRFFLVAASAMLFPVLHYGQPQYAVVDHTIGDFTNAVSLSVNAAGELFVLDAGRDELAQFSPAGELVKKIGGRGWGNLEFDSPIDVCANFALDIYVADFNNRRVQRFDRKMNFIQSFTADNIMPPLRGAFYPRACALSSQGELFVLELDGRRIIKFTTAQQLEREFGSFNAGAGALSDPRDIAVTPDGKVLVLDGHRVIEFDTFANFISLITIDSLLVPTSINAFANGILVVGPQGALVYGLDGSKRAEITAQSLMGFDGKGEFRDAAVVASTIYILTSRTLVAAKLPAP